MPTLSFRPIVPQDLPIINRLMRDGKGYWGYAEEGLDRFMERFGIADVQYFDHAFGYMAESAEGVVGYYLFKTSERPIELDHFFLDTQLIGQGYGRQLWEHCITQCQKHGWTEFVFWSDPHSQGFYEHVGAVKIDERPMVTLPGQMAPIMKYVVSAPG